MPLVSDVTPECPLAVLGRAGSDRFPGAVRAASHFLYIEDFAVYAVLMPDLLAWRAMSWEELPMTDVGAIGIVLACFVVLFAILYALDHV